MCSLPFHQIHKRGRCQPCSPDLPDHLGPGYETEPASKRKGHAWDSLRHILYFPQSITILLIYRYCDKEQIFNEIGSRSSGERRRNGSFDHKLRKKFKLIDLCSWSERGANNAKVASSSLVGTRWVWFFFCSLDVLFVARGSYSPPPLPPIP